MPWFRLHTDIIDDYKLAQNDQDFRIWIYLMAVLKEQNGNNPTKSEWDIINLTFDELAWRFRIERSNLENALARFVTLKMVELVDNKVKIINWQKRQYCESYQRVKKHRDKTTVTRNGYETLQKRQKRSVSVSGIKSSLKREIVKRGRKKSQNIDVESLEVLNYLIEKSGKKFNLKAEGNYLQIRARLKEGYSVDDLKLIIDDRVDKWGNDFKTRDWLNPITLFRPSHIEKNLAAARDIGGQNVTKIPIKTESAADEEITKIPLPPGGKTGE